jgi:hypothetical protein
MQETKLRSGFRTKLSRKKERKDGILMVLDGNGDQPDGIRRRTQRNETQRT